MSKLRKALGRGLSARQWLRILLLLVGCGCAGLVLALLAASRPAHPVTLSFLRDGWVISNRLPHEVWWRIQTGATNSYGALRLESYDGTNYQSGVWNGISQYSGEPAVPPHSSWHPFLAHPRVRVKSGERVWLVWTAQPYSEPFQRGALSGWRVSLSHFLNRHGWRRTGTWVRPKTNDPHVEELVVP